MIEKMAAFKEVAGTGIEAVKKEGLRMSADEVRKLSDAIQNADNGFRFKPHDMKIAAERRPAQVARDVAHRLMKADSSVSPEKWKAAGMMEREKMIRDTARILAEELMVPHFEVQFMEAPSAYRGNTTAFLAKNEAGELVLSDSVKPVVTINRSLMRKGSIFDPLNTLFHESLHVMQQYACTEKGNTVLHLPQRELWRKESMDMLDGKIKNQTAEEYFTTAMEEYAHAYSGFMVRCYEQMMIDEMKR